MGALVRGVHACQECKLVLLQLWHDPHQNIYSLVCGTRDWRHQLLLQGRILHITVPTLGGTDQPEAHGAGQHPMYTAAYNSGPEGDVAQIIERALSMREVVGSMPTVSS